MAQPLTKEDNTILLQALLLALKSAERATNNAADGGVKDAYKQAADKIRAVYNKLIA